MVAQELSKERCPFILSLKLLLCYFEVIFELVYLLEYFMCEFSCSEVLIFLMDKELLQLFYSALKISSFLLILFILELLVFCKPSFGLLLLFQSLKHAVYWSLRVDILKLVCIGDDLISIWFSDNKVPQVSMGWFCLLSVLSNLSATCFTSHLLSSSSDLVLDPITLISDEVHRHLKSLNHLTRICQVIKWLSD